jgi:hypothetical protein
MNFNIKDVVLKATQYESGYVNDKDDYVISASMIGKEPLQNYLSIVNGVVHNEEIDDTTLGSVFHIGMEIIMLNKLNKNDGSGIRGIEKSWDWKLSNGWILSGTADLVTTDEHGAYSIHDYKLSKSYTLKMLKKEINTHTYTKQLQILETLMKLDKNRSELEVKLIVEFFAKDAKAIENEPTHTSLIVPNKQGTEEMNAVDTTLNEVLDITNSLQSYIETGQIPPKCTDVWPRNVKGKIINTKCALYCSHGKAGLCPHFDPIGRREVERLSSW